MTQIAQVQVGRIHSLSIVCNLNSLLAALLDGYLYTGGSGIDCVFDKFLYG